MTNKERARYRAIIQQLSRMSANGWDRATHDDYAPLEAELAVLAEKLVNERVAAIKAGKLKEGPRLLAHLLPRIRR